MGLSRASISAFAVAALLPFAAQAAQSLRMAQTITTEGPVSAVSWNASGDRLAVMSNFGGRIKVFHFPHFEEEASFDPDLNGRSGNAVAFLNNDTVLTLGHLQKTLLDWSLEPAKEERAFLTPSDSKPHGRTTRFAVSKDGQFIAVLTVDHQYGVEVFDAHTGALLWAASQYNGDHFVAVAFAHSGAELAIATGRGEILIADPRSGSITRTIQAHDPASEIRCSALAFSPDDRFILAGRANNVKRQDDDSISADILDAKTGAHEDELPGSMHETSAVWSVDWSPSGDLVAIGDGASLRIWNVASDKPSLVIEEKAPQGVYSLQFSIKGVLAAGFSREVRIYR
jgi:WD40 repeat protein